MNVLKAYTHVAEELDAETGKYALYAYDVDGTRTKIDDTELVYLKSDVDKAIDDLEESHKKEVGQLLIDMAELKQKNDDSRYNIAVLRKDRSRQKYKRCLDKAEMCKARYDEEDAKVNGCWASWEYISKDMRYWERWHKRWLEIAEIFKPNN